MPVPYQKHGRRHRPDGEDPIPERNVVYAIKLSGDNDGVNDAAVPLDGAFQFQVPSELDGWYIVKFWGYQTEAPNLGTDTDIGLRRLRISDPPDVGVTSSDIVIPDNGYNDKAVLLPNVNQVAGEDDIIIIDIVDVDGAYGLGVEITFSPVNVRL